MSNFRACPGSWNDPIGGLSSLGDLFKKPKVKVVKDPIKDEADAELKKRKRRLRRSREAFQSRVASLGPIQLQAPALGGL